MVKSILLAVDGSAYTEFVLKYGVALAKAFDAHLRVLTVVDVRFFEWAVAIGVEGFAPVLPSTTFQEESQKILEEKADKVLQRAGEMLTAEGVKFSLEKESGSPVEVICEKVKVADLLVMGSRGEFEKWSDKMLGATFESVSRLSIKPIFVVHKEYRPIQKIMLAYDGSENSNRALPWAGFWAEKFQTPLVVLTVHDDAEEGQTVLNEATAYLQSYNIPEMQTLLKSGDTAETIVGTAREINADVIAMGSYGHSRIREAILGSTTVQVMRKSPVPVLMVK